MQKQPSIAVLLSAFNGEKFIREQIDSILAQRGDFSLQLYIRDDGSTDGTGAILLEYDSCETVHVFFGENVGITESYFRLIRLAGEHDYYSLSDQDDVWLPDKLSCAVRALEKEKAGCPENFPLLYGCQSHIVNERLEKTGQTTQRQLRPLTIRNTAVQNILLGHNQVFNHALAEELLSKELDYSRIYAHDLWITQAASITGRIIFENEPHTLYRQHGKNELGYGSGAGTLKWVVYRIKRAVNGESRLVGKQADSLFNVYGQYLDQKDRDDLRKFVSGSTFVRRVGCLFGFRYYRQKRSETVMLKILFLLGGYKM